jgi:hypothetical protein
MVRRVTMDPYGGRTSPELCAVTPRLHTIPVPQAAQQANILYRRDYAKRLPQEPLGACSAACFLRPSGARVVADSLRGHLRCYRLALLPHTKFVGRQPPVADPPHNSLITVDTPSYRAQTCTRTIVCGYFQSGCLVLTRWQLKKKNLIRRLDQHD